MTTPRAALLAALAAVAVYVGTLGNGFVWDDHIHIEAAPFVKDARNLRVLASGDFWMRRVEVEGSARPLHLASLLVDRAVWGELPAGYHLTNIVLHACAAAALTLLAAALAAPPSTALLAGLLFALHPVQTEAVCGISFRFDILAALFVFLGLIAARRAHGGRAAGWTAAAAAAFGLALLGKESAVVFPALALLAEWLAPPPRARAKLKWIHLGIFVLVLGAYAAFRAPRGGYDALAAPSVPAVSPAPAAVAASVKREEKGEEKPAPLAAAPAPPAPVSTEVVTAATAPAARAPARRATLRPPEADVVHSAPIRKNLQLDPSPPPWKAALPTSAKRARAMLSVFLDYARLVAWPAGLQADRSAVLDPARLPARAVGGAALALMMLGAAWWARRRHPAASLGLAWFLVALAPVSGLVPLHNLIAERYLYLPLAGLCLAAAAALAAAARRASRPALALGCAGALLSGAAAATTALRVPAWKDDASLFGGRVASDGSRLRYNRARLAREARDYDAARAEYRKALELDPNSVEALVNLAEVEVAVGNTDRELALVRRAAALSPLSSTVQEAFGYALERAGRRKEALAAFKQAVENDDSSPTARAHYVLLLAQSGQTDKALKHGAIAAKLDPGNANIHYANGRIAQDAGRFAAAAESFRLAVRADSKHALAWANLGVCLHRGGKHEAALGAMLMAIRLAPDSADSRRNLGALYDDLGRGSEAEKSYAEAVRLDEGSALGWHAYAVVLQKSGNASSAAGAYERALAIEPNKVESLVNLAGLRLQLGEPDRAEEYLARALAARPGDEVLIRAIESFERATGRRIAR